MATGGRSLRAAAMKLPFFANMTTNITPAIPKAESCGLMIIGVGMFGAVVRRKR
jgi:hypothetical protein